MTHTALMHLRARSRQSELEKMGAPALSEAGAHAQMDRIEHLELMVAKLQRQHFGPKSEKAAMNADQLMLSLSRKLVIEAQPVVQVAAASGVMMTRLLVLPARAAPFLRTCHAQESELIFPSTPHAPAATESYASSAKMYRRDVGSTRRPMGFFVIRHVRPKMSCRKCSTVVQAPAPERVLRSRPSRTLACWRT